MALFKTHNISLDTIRTPRLALQNIVVGETGNKLSVTLTNDGSPVALDDTNYRVCLRVDSNKGTCRQDSALLDSGISFSNGKAIIKLSRDVYATGVNHARLEVFSTDVEENDTLISSAEFTFRAIKNDTGENVGEVYPSLIVVEQEARQAADAANDAADAASTAASSAISAAQRAEDAAALIDTIDDYPTPGSPNLVKSGGVSLALSTKVNKEAGMGLSHADFTTQEKQKLQSVAFGAEKNVQSDWNQASSAADDYIKNKPFVPTAGNSTPLYDSGNGSVGTSMQYARADHRHPPDPAKQNLLTFDDFPTQNSNNPVKSGGIAAALSALAGKIPVFIELQDATWTIDQATGEYIFTGSASDLISLRAAAFATNKRPVMLWVELFNNPGEHLLLVERHRVKRTERTDIGLMSAYDGNHTYATAEITVYPSDDTQHTTTITGTWVEI